MCLDHRGFGLRIDLHDLDAVRADQRANATAGAVIDAVVDGRRARLAHPLRLRPDRLGTGEQIGVGATVQCAVQMLHLTHISEVNGVSSSKFSKSTIDADYPFS
jgi:hypothetical protein